MGNHNRLTEKQFELAITLSNGGASTQKVAELTGLGISTVTRIKQYGNFKDYTAAYIARRTKSEPAKEEPKPVSVPWDVRQEMQKTNELLKSISAKLAFIVEELGGEQDGKENG